MKNIDFYMLKQTFSAVPQMSSKEFKFLMLLNEELVDNVIDKLDKVKEPSPEFKKYQEDLNELVLELCELDTDTGGPKLFTLKGGHGSPRYDGNGYPRPKEGKEKEYDNRLSILEGKHDEALKLQKAAQKEFSELLDAEATIKPKFHKIKFSLVPDDLDYGVMKTLNTHKILIKD